MIFKTLLAAALILSLKLVYNAMANRAPQPEAPIDKAWWDGLTDEWKRIFIINQNLSRQGIDIYAVQKGHVNRLRKEGDEDLSPMNTALHELHSAQDFGLSYEDFYARAQRKHGVQHTDSIDLATLADLETVYMINGPSDLSPLRKLRSLKVLILNFSGMPYNVPIREQSLDLEPLRNLTTLTVLHCVSTPVKTLAPIANLVNLEELMCDNTAVTSLSPLKKLVKLKRLAVGSNISTAADLSHLAMLEELYISGCRNVSALSKLKALKNLVVTENEMAIVNARYRIDNLDFLNNLNALAYVDLRGTSYHGSLDVLSGRPNLKAVALPRVSRTDVDVFKKNNAGCVILNAYEFE
ncbi:leucine-rich repeat domain-containing protein [Chryseolinea lacunae]|uniref:Disease resistance R13L4/SHOC-2-like LRR domain-containing protein n=1 Tax=Chryseolinea lacunae TaxID=2801331 RepID=A0ABS1KNT3_9BACT|nr:hypothetical protein [Chryseolinea lacunae]MBL0741004.1 hypothetical protein [Chryseolinea lacunae]